MADNDMEHMDHLEDIAEQDVEALRKAEANYHGSWKRRGGVGAFMMAARKWDRLEEQVKKCGYDIFAAIESDRRAEGVIDDLRDLRRYLDLIEAEMRSRGIVPPEVRKD